MYTQRRFHVVPVFCLLCLFVTSGIAVSQEALEEVDKGNVPVEYLDESLKTLPNGVTIWDVDEAIQALQDRSGAYLWIDTRPTLHYMAGSIANAVHLFYNKNESGIPDDENNILTHDTLDEAIQKLQENKQEDLMIVFFCQGPECHRSFNVSLRAVQQWNFDPSHIIWFRAGYPALADHVMNNPKLKRRIARYLQGHITQ